jgi:hypothetical protein
MLAFAKYRGLVEVHIDGRGRFIANPPGRSQITTTTYKTMTEKLDAALNASAFTRWKALNMDSHYGNAEVTDVDKYRCMVVGVIGGRWQLEWSNGARTTANRVIEDTPENETQVVTGYKRRQEIADERERLANEGIAIHNALPWKSPKDVEAEAETEAA